MKFELIKTAAGSKARLGKITTARGVINTPIFMPVGTQATVKAMSPEELKTIGAEIILGNTYHLFLKPGHETIRKLGGLHKFMNWDRPILTDSGGYQIFCLSHTRKMTEEGAHFQSPIDGGAAHLLTPELAIEIQQALDSDIMMVLDECLPYPASETEAKGSMELSLRWAARSLKAKTNGRALFGIIQGGMYPHLRKEYIERLMTEDRRPRTEDNGPKAKNFDGYAIGGLSVG
ncbi:MAG: tRNA guanosine(34) transglycosylase Tgt, partial [Deltaproteobacteria bacterium]|nr:tRNA guanosine(34) transglycosylase Tgt [Deltaproteobacteria bacterium]